MEKMKEKGDKKYKGKRKRIDSDKEKRAERKAQKKADKKKVK